MEQIVLPKSKYLLYGFEKEGLHIIPPHGQPKRFRGDTLLWLLPADQAGEAVQYRCGTYAVQTTRRKTVVTFDSACQITCPAYTLHKKKPPRGGFSYYAASAFRRTYSRSLFKWKLCLHPVILLFSDPHREKTCADACDKQGNERGDQTDIEDACVRNIFIQPEVFRFDSIAGR